jgi:hypothetical protein
MCMKVKQFGANMCKQVVIVLRFFLDCFKLLKTHNMVTLMLDPHFKDLSSVGDYIDHSFAVEIVARHMIVNSSSQPSRPCTKSCMNNQMFLQMLFLLFIWKTCESNYFLVCTLQANLFGDFVRVCKFDEDNHAFIHLMCHWKK